MKVLHVMYTYYPDVTGGSVRSAGIVEALRSLGVESLVISSPFQAGVEVDVGVECVNGIRVLRTHRGNNLTVSEKPSSLRAKLRKLLSFWTFAREVRQTASAEGVQVIHAHSTFYCAFAGIFAGLGTQIPVAYEVRSLWEERAGADGFTSRAVYWCIRVAESLARRLVHQVICINQGLYDVIMQRHRRLRRPVAIVPNAVADDLLLAAARSSRAESSAVVFAYVGNLSQIEGLDQLVKAFAMSFADPNENVRLRIYGRGLMAETLKGQIEAVGDQRITYEGPFGRADVADVYSAVDVIVNPRRNLKITQTVTPLKPLEALAFGKGLILSDVKGLKEVVFGYRGYVDFVNADDVADLARSLRLAFLAFKDASFRATNAQRAFEYARSNCSWNANARRYLEIYEGIRKEGA